MTLAPGPDRVGPGSGDWLGEPIRRSMHPRPTGPGARGTWRG